MLVLAGHTEWIFAPGFLPFIRSGHLATLAVGVFFVLSGFVIGYAVHEREKDARSYFVGRAARVYSVAVPALVLTLMSELAWRVAFAELLCSDTKSIQLLQTNRKGVN